MTWRQKIVPRFSLRTLLLAVLTLASAATLWRNSGLFAPARRIELTGEQHTGSFDSNGRWIVAEAYGKEPTEARVLSMHIFDPNSGAEKLTLLERDHCQYSHFRFSESSSYVSYHVQVPNQVRCHKLWHIESGHEIALKTFCSVLPNYLTFVANDRVMLVTTEDEQIIVAMPEGRVNHRFPKDECRDELTPDGRWFIRATNSIVKVYSAESGQLLRTWSPPSNSQKVVAFSPRAAQIAFITGETDKKFTIICDSLTGRALHTLPGGDPADTSPFFPDERHYVLYQNIWQLEPEFKLCGLALTDGAQPAIKVDGDLLRTYSQLYAPPGGCFVTFQAPISFDMSSGQIIWKGEQDVQFTENYDFAVLRANASQIFCTRTGKKLFTLSPSQWKNDVCENAFPRFSPHRPEFLTAMFSTTGEKEPSQHFGANTGNTRITLWRPTRPEEWYGPACLPEFWLALTFAIGLIWSLLTDRRRLQEPRPQGSGNV